MGAIVSGGGSLCRGKQGDQEDFLPIIPVSALERTVLSTSSFTNAYFDRQTSVQQAEPGQIIVTSADCKGVVIRKPSAEKTDSKQENKPANIEQVTPKGHYGNKKWL